MTHLKYTDNLKRGINVTVDDFLGLIFMNLDHSFRFNYHHGMHRNCTHKILNNLKTFLSIYNVKKISVGLNFQIKGTNQTTENNR